MNLKHLYGKKGIITLAIAVSSLAVTALPSYAIDLGELNSNLNKLIQDFRGNVEEYASGLYDQLLGEDVANRIPSSLAEVLGGEVGPEFHKISELAQTIASEDSSIDSQIDQGLVVDNLLTNEAIKAIVEGYYSGEAAQERIANTNEGLVTAANDSTSIATQAANRNVSQDLLRDINGQLQLLTQTNIVNAQQEVDRRMIDTATLEATQASRHQLQEDAQVRRDDLAANAMRTSQLASMFSTAPFSETN